MIPTFNFLRNHWQCTKNINLYDQFSVKRREHWLTHLVYIFKPCTGKDEWYTVTFECVPLIKHPHYIENLLVKDISGASQTNHNDSLLITLILRCMENNCYNEKWKIFDWDPTQTLPCTDHAAVSISISLDKYPWPGEALGVNCDMLDRSSLYMISIFERSIKTARVKASRIQLEGVDLKDSSRGIYQAHRL